MTPTAAPVLLALLLTGCSGAPPASAPVPHPDDGHRPVLNEGSWGPGDLSLLARGGGRVSVDDAGCIHLLVPGPSAVDVVWPAGFTADEVAGRAVIRNARGEIVLQQGDRVVVGGGFAASDDLRCQVSEGGDAFHVQQRLPPRTSP